MNRVKVRHNNCDYIKELIYFPPFMNDESEKEKYFNKIISNIHKAKSLNLTINPEKCSFPTISNLPYYMNSERSSLILSEFNELFISKANLNYKSDFNYSEFNSSKTIRIGFVFSNICENDNNNNIKQLEGIIVSLVPLNFNITILSIYSCNYSNYIIENVNYDLLFDNLEENINKIEKYQFDILFYNDIISDWNIYLLANLRLSQIQISYYGSMIKTPFNLSTIDYYLTIDNSYKKEILNSTYTQIIRLEDQGIWFDYQFEHSSLQPVNGKKIKYLCFIELQYIDISFLKVLKEIIMKVKDSELLLIESYIFYIIYLFRRSDEWNMIIKKRINSVFNEKLKMKIKYLKYTSNKDILIKYLCESNIIIESFNMNDEKLSLHSLVNNVYIYIQFIFQ